MGLVAVESEGAGDCSSVPDNDTSFSMETAGDFRSPGEPRGVGNRGD